ncbi:uncharacterized protein MICPUCDRAFT_54539 [Micromonas pusilla CCMP1545]|uniref:Predicted protein n=1 Tax=Micromonas pusilla (strain CCMP1545) TaxID=564608 RepID=C1N9M2_MICPC|nr:uncharacterized protein MICPUCDRAFT_54539 [Micromonas pusilla CCMP1545]EEH50970.1 predicted protein [Micromonas pusilla CCMP1545]|eukprot:XP_003064636.1 predicted protein [Micromonas pusilla CCMP1545]
MAASALNASSVFLGSRVATPSTRRASRSKRASKVAVRAKQCEESDLMAKYPEGGPVFRVSIDCTMGTNSTGIVMKEGDEGRPEVSAIRPGGTAKNKLKIGDVCLGVTYTELVADPNNKTLNWGTPQVGWFDTEGEKYQVSIAAMETNSTTLDMIMFRPE